MADNVLAQLGQQMRQRQQMPPSQADLAARQQMLRERLMTEDPATYARYVARGYDQGPSSGMALAQTNQTDPATAMAPYVVQAQPQEPIDPAQQMQSDLIWRSWNSPRGQQQNMANARDNSILRRRIEHLQNNPTQQDTGDGDTSMNRRALDYLLWMTGQGGGMRP